MPRALRLVRRIVLTLVVVAAGLIAGTPRPALAIHGHHGFHHGGWHVGGGWGGWGPHWGGGHCGFGPWGGGWPACGFGGYGWGVPCWPTFGSVSYGTGFAFGGTRFWSGTTILGVPGWGGWGWGAPAWYGGWNPGPAWGWNPGPAWGWGMPFANAAPVGVAPFHRPFRPGIGGGGGLAFGLAAGRGPRTTQGTIASGRPVAVGGVRGPVDTMVGRGQLGGPQIDAAVQVAIRTSNAPARARAARLVALGDRHLRDAIADPARVAKAVDAYRRAASIAPDQPDTFLRQAIALTAAGKAEAAATAVGRAVAIDTRLAAGAGAEGVAHAAKLVPLGAAAPTVLVVRTEKLLTRIFSDADLAPDAPAGNWIAQRWLGRDAGPVMIAARP